MSKRSALTYVVKTILLIPCLVFCMGAGCEEDLEPPVTEQEGEIKFSGGIGKDCGSGYDGPEFDIQVDSQCKMAYAYQCAGDEEGRQVACELYRQWEDSWTGSGSFPECPYCN